MTKLDKAIVYCFLHGASFADIVKFVGVDAKTIEMALRAYVNGK